MTSQDESTILREDTPDYGAILLCGGKTALHAEVKKKPLVQSVERALDILETIARERGPMRPVDIAGALGLHPNTAQNLIRTLYRRQYLTQTEDGRYYLGGQCFQIGVLCDPWGKLRQAALPIMQALSRETGDNAFLGVESGGKLVGVAKTESTGVIAVNEDQAWLDQMHCTATGKVLLAYAEPAWLHTFLRSQSFAGNTTRTLTRPDDLKTGLLRVRERGYASCEDESADGISSVGVPLFGRDGLVIAALGQSFPTFFLTSGTIDIETRARLLHSYASEITQAYAGGMTSGHPAKRGG